MRIGRFQKIIRISRFLPMTIAFLVVAFVLSTDCPSYAMKPSEIYEKAKPAIVIIEAKHKFEFSIPTNISINAEELVKNVNALLSRSGSDRSPLAVGKALYSELAERPMSCLEAESKLRSVDITFSAVGSGFIISPNGHVITNAHVIALSKSDLETLLEKYVSIQDFERGLRIIKEQLPETRNLNPASQDVIKKALLKAYAKSLRKHGKYEWTRWIKVVRCLDGGETKGYPASTLIAGTSIPGKDVAVLKIEGTGFPTIPIGDDTNLVVGSQLYCIGFPVAAAGASFVQKSSRSEATMTSGIVSSKKVVPAGWTLIQTDAAVSGGNSGGPAFDETGQVIGVATANVRDRESGAAVEGIHFVVPSTVIREFIDRSGIHLNKPRDMQPKFAPEGAEQPQTVGE